MDVDLNSNGNSKQVGNLTVLIGSDPFLPQPDSPTVEPDVITLDENLHTPPTPSVTPEYWSTESKQILQTPSSPLDKDPPLTDLAPIDPDIFASPLPKRRKRKATPPTALIPPNGTNSNILHQRVPTPIPTFIPHYHLKGATH